MIFKGQHILSSI